MTLAEIAIAVAAALFASLGIHRLYRRTWARPASEREVELKVDALRKEAEAAEEARAAKEARDAAARAAEAREAHLAAVPDDGLVAEDHRRDRERR